MSVGPVLSAAGLIRSTRRRGFCPLCRVWDDGAERESSPPALTALVFLGLAALAWALTIWQARSADEMAMGVGSVGAFATGWAVMIAAMMIPSAIPLIYEFA